MRADKDYKKKVHKILKTYNSILVKCKNIPLLSDKNIVIIENINSMVNAQMETRKPILYFQEEKCISFMILDGNECYVYVLKENEDVISEVERVINNCEYARNTFVKEILSKIETVLLSSNIEKENTLTENEIKYLESIKENSEEKSKAEEPTLQNSSDNLYLVPVKNKMNFFNKNRNKKAKRLIERKNGRRRKIG